MRSPNSEIPFIHSPREPTGGRFFNAGYRFDISYNITISLEWLTQPCGHAFACASVPTASASCNCRPIIDLGNPYRIITCPTENKSRAQVAGKTMYTAHLDTLAHTFVCTPALWQCTSAKSYYAPRLGEDHSVRRLPGSNGFVIFILILLNACIRWRLCYTLLRP